MNNNRILGVQFVDFVDFVYIALSSDACSAKAED